MIFQRAAGFAAVVPVEVALLDAEVSEPAAAAAAAAERPDSVSRRTRCKSVRRSAAL